MEFRIRKVQATVPCIASLERRAIAKQQSAKSTAARHPNQKFTVHNLD